MKHIKKDATSQQLNTTKTTLPYERLISLFEISQKINQIGDTTELLHDILHSAITQIGAERGMIILVDQSGRNYQTVASESLEKGEEAFSSSIVRKTLEQKKTLMSADLKSDQMFKDAASVKGLNILSFICVPLMLPGRTSPIGTLYVDQRIHVKTFTEEDKVFLESFANFAAIAINNVSHVEKLVNENVELRNEVSSQYKFPGLVGHSEALEKVLTIMKQITNDDCTVLIIGESGTGKELVAKAIHYNGYRKAQPFLAIDCGALPETILEAELFGSVKGAFTGAIDKRGLFEAAEGGTLFLDEIQHTSEAMQIKLLRTLQEREILRVGSTKPISVDVRLICATNEDVQTLVKQNRLRQDFYYRINVVTINIPPLRERRQDIPLLAEHLLEKYCRLKNKNIRGFDQEALRAMTEYNWVENNVRELENEIERAVIFTEEGRQIGLFDLSEKVQGVRKQVRTAAKIFVDEGDKALNHAQFEREYIQFILAKAGGNKSKAAQLMGLPRTTLIGKMNKYGLK